MLVHFVFLCLPLTSAVGPQRITRKASARIANYAFELAAARGTERGSCTVTAVHKSNVCKQTDGLFLEETRRVAASFAPGVDYNEALVDSLCAGLVLKPDALVTITQSLNGFSICLCINYIVFTDFSSDFRYDVLVAPNCWGDIVSDLAGGIVGSLGLLGSANIGAKHALFEASHGSAPDLAGTGKVNPISMQLSAAMMLRHVGETKAATVCESAIRSALADGCVTSELGGNASTAEFTQEICHRVGKH